MAEGRVTHENIWCIASQLMDTAFSMGIGAEQLSDVCFAICAEDSESGSNQLYLDEEIFTTVSEDDLDIATLLSKMGIEPYYEGDSCHAVPKVQFLRVLGLSLIHI